MAIFRPIFISCIQLSTFFLQIIIMEIVVCPCKYSLGLLTERQRNSTRGENDVEDFGLRHFGPEINQRPMMSLRQEGLYWIY